MRQNVCSHLEPFERMLACLRNSATSLRCFNAKLKISCNTLKTSTKYCIFSAAGQEESKNGRSFVRVCQCQKFGLSIFYAHECTVLWSLAETGIKERYTFVHPLYQTFYKKNTNVEFLDKKWTGCALFLPKYRSSIITWSDQVDSKGLLHEFMGF